MSLPKKRMRSITIEGQRYGWRSVYEKVLWCAAACPIRLIVQRQEGRGQRLIATFAHSTTVDNLGRVLLLPRYGAAITPGKVADIIRAALAAGWTPAATGRPSFQMDGEPYLRLPPDPTQPPPGSWDEQKRRFLTRLQTQLLATCATQQPSTSEKMPDHPDHLEAKPD